MSSAAVIVDIDSTIVDPQYIEVERNGRIVWLHQDMELDPPIAIVIEMVKSLYDRYYQIVFCSARNEESRERTDKQLKKFFGLMPYKLYLRPDGDHRAVEESKADMLKQIKADGYLPVLAIDDDPNNCRMFVENGIHTLQTFLPK